MINKKTVFVLGAGASCPYGYQSGAGLRAWICFQQGFRDACVNNKHININMPTEDFINKFSKSSKQSIDLFMATNPKLAITGKHIIVFAIFMAEVRSRFREETKITQEFYSGSNLDHPATVLLGKGYFQGEDWYSYLFNKLTSGFTKSDVLPDFSDDKIAFITFNYDRSLEHILFESLSNTFTEVSQPDIIECLKKLKILHVYGKVAPLKWQDPEKGVDYRQKIDGDILKRSADNIRTIHEQKVSPELEEARTLLAQAQQIFFLGFGYAQENMEVLGLPGIIPYECWVYGTAFGAEDKEIEDIRGRIILGLKPGPLAGMGKNEGRIEIKNMDCLKLLRNYF